jgi:hypothetical protein
LILVGRHRLQNTRIILGFWASGLLGFWASGVLGFWSSGLLEFWASGVLAMGLEFVNESRSARSIDLIMNT